MILIITSVGLGIPIFGAKICVSHQIPRTEPVVLSSLDTHTYVTPSSSFVSTSLYDVLAIYACQVAQRHDKLGVTTR